MIDHIPEGKQEEKFSPWLFLATLLLTLGGLFALVAFLAPDTWRAQLAAPWWSFALCFVAVHAAAGAFEYFFHRYILHAPLVPQLSYFYKQHTRHHALTHIGYHRSKNSGADLPGFVEPDHVARNHFPIEHEKQHEASYFPWYSLFVFALVVTPLLLLGQWLFPSAPVFLAGYVAVAWSLALYELVHAVEHWPQDTWDRLIEHPTYGRFWRKAYAFHLRHHADIRCNEGISGFFALPVFDLLFGTYVDPETLYTHGHRVDPAQFSSPRPRFPLIRWLDRLAEDASKKRRDARTAA